MDGGKIKPFHAWKCQQATLTTLQTQRSSPLTGELVGISCHGEWSGVETLREFIWPMREKNGIDPGVAVISEDDELKPVDEAMNRCNRVLQTYS
jgi:hypothetical protein